MPKSDSLHDLNTQYLNRRYEKWKISTIYWYVIVSRFVSHFLTRLIQSCFVCYFFKMHTTKFFKHDKLHRCVIFLKLVY